MTASSLFSAINARARSMRFLRSSFVIGFARSRIDESAAIVGGSGPASAPAPRPRCADNFVTDNPAAPPVSHKNVRRLSDEGMVISSGFAHLVAKRAYVQDVSRKTNWPQSSQ